MITIDKDWDKVRATEDCLYCRGTGMNDPDNECGFCSTEPANNNKEY